MEGSSTSNMYKMFNLSDMEISQDGDSRTTLTEEPHPSKSSNENDVWKESRDIIAHYARKIDDFEKFSQSDQDILLEASWVEILCLYTAFHLANRYASAVSGFTIKQHTI